MNGDVNVAEEVVRRGPSKKVLKEIREWGISLIAVLLLSFLIRTFLFTIIRVEGNSMNETLQNGDRMVVNVLDMKLNGVRHGDVVICRYPNRDPYFVKRVIGLSGDVIEVQDGIVYRNGEALIEPYIIHKPNYTYGPYEVPEGKVFVLGDRRSRSNDSHSEEVGALDESQLIGIARYIIWPLSNIGSIEGGTQ